MNNFIAEKRDYIYDKFKDIVFVDPGHKYFVNNVEHVSVSSIIEKYSGHFDSFNISKNYAKKHGRTQEDVLKEWKYKNLKATTHGSKIHEFGEAYTWLKCGVPDKIPELIKKTQYIADEGWLFPFSGKEEGIIAFYESLPDSIIPVGAEFRMSSQYLENINTNFCGTADLLFYYNHPENPGFIIADWKTNESLTKDFARNNNKMMLPPFNDMVDEPISHYTFQFSMYQLMLESIGINVIGRRLVWLKPDGHEVFKIPDITEKLKKIL